MGDLAAARLRAIPSLTGTAPELDLTDLPPDPIDLFTRWLERALAEDVPEPHAMTLATVDADGMPDARTLILKGLDERGWAFAGPAASSKAEQLAARPAAALGFWWQPLVRAVRVRGRVAAGTPEERAADLAARSAAARDGMTVEDWRLWRVVAHHIEFWQGATDRRHVRITYRRVGDGWSLGATRGGEPIEVTSGPPRD